MKGDKTFNHDGNVFIELKTISSGQHFEEEARLFGVISHASSIYAWQDITLFLSDQISCLIKYFWVKMIMFTNKSQTFIMDTTEVAIFKPSGSWTFSILATSAR